MPGIDSHSDRWMSPDAFSSSRLHSGLQPDHQVSGMIAVIALVKVWISNASTVSTPIL